MRKFILACAAVAMMGQAYAANPLAENTSWSTGGTWNGRIAMTGTTANKLNSYIFGQVEGVTTVAMPDYFEEPNASMKVQIVFPDGSTAYNYPVKVTGQKDSEGNDVTNAFRFRTSEYGATTPGAYVCTIPAGCMTLDGTPNEETEVTFYVEDTRTFTPIDINFECSPNPILSLSSITGVKLTYGINWIDETTGATVDRRFVPETPNPMVDVYFEAADGTKVSATKMNSSAPTGYGAVSINPAVAITTPGEWTLVVPQGALRFNEYQIGASSPQLVCNKELRYTFTISGGNNYPVVDVCPSISPAPGLVSKISKIEFAAPEGFDMYLPDDILPITVTCPDQSSINMKPYTNDNVSGEYAWLSFVEEFTAEGEYTFSVPQGCFEYFVGSTPYVNKAFTFTYTVQAMQEIDMPFEITPADGSKLYSFYEVYLALPEGYSATFTTGSTATLTYPDGSTAQRLMSYSALNHRLMVDCGYNPSKYPEDSEFGVYTLVIPARTLMNDNGDVNKEITLSYTLLPRLPQDVNFAIDPEEGNVSRLYIIELLAPDVEKLEPVEGGIQQVTIRCPEGVERTEYLKKTTSAKRFQVNLGEPVTEEGDYALIVPENAFRVYNTDGTQAINTQAVFTWTITTGGVDGIESEDGLYNVYTLSGVKVAEKATREELRNLKGFYIVNGKAYFIQ